MKLMLMPRIFLSIFLAAIHADLSVAKSTASAKKAETEESAMVLGPVYGDAEAMTLPEVDDDGDEEEAPVTRHQPVHRVEVPPADSAPVGTKKFKHDEKLRLAAREREVVDVMAGSDDDLSDQSSDDDEEADDDSQDRESTGNSNLDAVRTLQAQAARFRRDAAKRRQDEQVADRERMRNVVHELMAEGQEENNYGEMRLAAKAAAASSLGRRIEAEFSVAPPKPQVSEEATTQKQFLARNVPAIHEESATPPVADSQADESSQTSSGDQSEFLKMLDQPTVIASSQDSSAKRMSTTTSKPEVAEHKETQDTSDLANSGGAADYALMYYRSKLASTQKQNSDLLKQLKEVTNFKQQAQPKLAELDHEHEENRQLERQVKKLTDIKAQEEAKLDADEGELAQMKLRSQALDAAQARLLSAEQNLTALHKALAKTTDSNEKLSRRVRILTMNASEVMSDANTSTVLNADDDGSADAALMLYRSKLAKEQQENQHLRKLLKQAATWGHNVQGKLSELDHDRTANSRLHRELQQLIDTKAREEKELAAQKEALSSQSLQLRAFDLARDKLHRLEQRNKDVTEALAAANSSNKLLTKELVDKEASLDAARKQHSADFWALNRTRTELSNLKAAKAKEDAELETVKGTLRAATKRMSAVEDRDSTLRSELNALQGQLAEADKRERLLKAQFHKEEKGLMKRIRSTNATAEHEEKDLHDAEAETKRLRTEIVELIKRVEDGKKVSEQVQEAKSAVGHAEVEVKQLQASAAGLMAQADYARSVAKNATMEAQLAYEAREAAQASLSEAERNNTQLEKQNEAALEENRQLRKALAMAVHLNEATAAETTTPAPKTSHTSRRFRHVPGPVQGTLSGHPTNSLALLEKGSKHTELRTHTAEEVLVRAPLPPSPLSFSAI